MSGTPTPWIGLIALAAMFVIPFLPDWLFEGPRTVKHWPRRHICGNCGAPWTEQHTCAPQASTMSSRPLHGELRRLQQPNPNQQVLTSMSTTLTRSHTDENNPAGRCPAQGREGEGVSPHDQGVAKASVTNDYDGRNKQSEHQLSCSVVSERGPLRERERGWT
jgi:hypothetical protein